MAQSRVIVVSADAMVYEDLAYLRNRPNFKFLLEHGSLVKRCRTIYPTITYPCHTTMATGVYPNKHQLVNNNELHIGMKKNIPWNWFHDAVKCPDIFTAAKRAGLKTASVFWPCTGNHPDIDYLVDEYWPQFPGDDVRDVYLRAGTTPDVYEKCVAPYMEGLRIRSHPATDQFLIDCACDMIRNYQPHLLMIHTGNIDAYRHDTGLFNDKVTQGLEEHEVWLGQLIDATKEAGVYEETNFFIISDHGQMEIKRSIRPNVVLADYGLISYDEKGDLVDWKAYCFSAGMSAQVYLKDPADKETYDKTYALLKHMRDEGIYGISEVWTTEEINEKEHLSGDFSFVLETDGYTSFANGWTRPIIKQFDVSDYRFGYATHGYHPDKGPQPTFMGFGPDIKQGVVLERRPTVDEAPTYAKILGCEMPWADGTPIAEILK